MGEDSPIHQQLVDTTGNCLSTGLEMKFKSGAYVTAFWQGDKLRGVRGPQMDALKEGRCLLVRVPLHRACFGISGMDGLATCKKCKPGHDPQLSNRWDRIHPMCGSSDLTGFPPEMELARPRRGVSRLPPLCSHPAQARAAPAGWGSTLPVLQQDLQPDGGRSPCLGWGGTGRTGRTRSHTSRTASFPFGVSISQH